MEKILNQDEIDAIVRAMRSGARVQTDTALSPQVEAWDLRLAGQIGREQLQAITLLHEGFARNLTHSLGAFLRAPFSTTLVSAEHLTYRDFLQRIPETTYVASCRLEPMGATSALQLDLKVAFPIIDLLLGGEGKSMATPRELTEIEEQILDSVARIVFRELGAAWQAMALPVSFEERVAAGAAPRLMSSAERILAVSFEIAMPEVRGGLSLAVPATVSNALLRKMSPQFSQHRPRGGSDARQQLMQRLLACPFDLELAVTDARLPVSALAGLAQGILIRFDRSVCEPASLLISGREMFLALPAQHGNVRAMKLADRVTEPAGDDARSREKTN